MKANPQCPLCGYAEPSSDDVAVGRSIVDLWSEKIRAKVAHMSKGHLRMMLAAIRERLGSERQMPRFEEDFEIALEAAILAELKRGKRKI